MQSMVKWYEWSFCCHKIAVTLSVNIVMEQRSKKETGYMFSVCVRENETVVMCSVHAGKGDLNSAAVRGH